MDRKILILCDYPFPDGLAATNRIFAYSKGLVSNGIDTEILTLSPFGILIGSKKTLSLKYRDIICHHPYFYYLNGSKFIRYIDLRMFVIKGIFLLNNLCRDNKYDSVVISFDNKILITLFLPILLLNKKKIGFISDEYPPAIRNLKSKISYFDIYFYRIFNKFISYRIVISEALKNYYNINFGSKPTHILNSIVDEDRFTDNNDYKVKQCLTYFGNCELKKDNVDNIIKAFSLISNLYPHIFFNIYGSPKFEDLENLKNLIITLKLENKVFLKGRVNNDEVVKILKESLILVTSQPKTIRANGGFPTKLGEYLISGRPAILTDVGEISNYIIDGVNAFLVIPESPEEYAKKIIQIIANYEDSMVVARYGKKFITDNFTCVKATIGLAKFLKTRI